MAKPAPRCDTNNKSDAMFYQANVAGLGADPDLTRMSGYPKWAPQKTTLWVDSAGAAIALIDEDDVTHTIDVPPGTTIVLTRPIKSIDESASGDVNALFEWFDPQGSPDWNK